MYEDITTKDFLEIALASSMETSYNLLKLINEQRKRIETLERELMNKDIEEMLK